MGISAFGQTNVFQATLKPFQDPKDQKQIEDLLNLAPADFRLFTIDLNAIDSFLQVQNGAFSMQIHIDQGWNWTLNLERTASMGGFNYAYKGSVVGGEACRLYVAKRYLLGKIEQTDRTMRFLPAWEVLGSIYKDMFVVYAGLTPPFAYEQSNEPLMATGIVELGIDIDNGIYDFFVHQFDNDVNAALQAISMKIQDHMDPVNDFFELRHSSGSSSSGMQNRPFLPGYRANAASILYKQSFCILLRVRSISPQ